MMPTTPARQADRPRSPDRRRGTAYALPALFGGQSVSGFVATQFRGQCWPAGRLGHNQFLTDSLAISISVFLDGLDGRIARP
jgi:hypothetical protein